MSVQHALKKVTQAIIRIREQKHNNRQMIQAEGCIRSGCINKQASLLNGQIIISKNLGLHQDLELSLDRSIQIQILMFQIRTLLTSMPTSKQATTKQPVLTQCSLLDGQIQAHRDSRSGIQIKSKNLTLHLELGLDISLDSYVLDFNPGHRYAFQVA